MGLYIIQDKWTYKNYQVMLETEQFQKLNYFVSTHKNLKSEFSINYTFNCEQIGSTLAVLTFLLQVYLGTLLVCAFWQVCLGLRGKLR